MSEFSKCNHSLVLSIFIEDVLFYFLFFVFGVSSTWVSNSLEGIVFALFLATLITAITCFILFKFKFNLKINTLRVRVKDFSYQDFRLGINYTILRGNEFFSNFGVRYLGQIYFGDIFVSYAHIMYQFYNLFALLTMAVISGLQSKITVKKDVDFNTNFVKKTYLNIIKTTIPFVLGAILIIVLFKAHILGVFFPKYVEYSALLVVVSFTGLIFMIIQPFVFILIYNNKIYNVRVLNIAQYLVMFFIYLVPLVYPAFNE
ncbi:hypothetical protein N9Q68_01625, partial [Polaribacter sp.]|nr:hypothetical protein [Polaribacter sp.]